MTWQVVTATSLHSAARCCGVPTDSAAELAETVAQARAEGAAYVAVTTAAEALAGVHARTLVRRMSKLRPDGPVPWALPPRHGRPRLAVATARVAFSAPRELCARVDAARGREPTAQWWARAAERQLAAERQISEQ